MATPACRMWAHDWLTERGFGRPQQTIEIAGEATKRPIDFSAMTIVQLEALAALKASNEPEPEPEPDPGPTPESPPTLRIVTDDEPGGAA